MISHPSTSSFPLALEEHAIWCSTEAQGDKPQNDRDFSSEILCTEKEKYNKLHFHQWFSFSINSACSQHGSLSSMPHCRRRCPAHHDHEETCQGSSTFLSPKFDVFLFACFFVFVSGTLWIWCCEMAWAHIYFIILVIYVFVCWLWMKVVSSQPYETHMLFIITPDCWALRLSTGCCVFFLNYR